MHLDFFIGFILSTSKVQENTFLCSEELPAFEASFNKQVFYNYNIFNNLDFENESPNYGEEAYLINELDTLKESGCEHQTVPNKKSETNEHEDFDFLVNNCYLSLKSQNTEFEDFTPSFTLDEFAEDNELPSFENQESQKIIKSLSHDIGSVESTPKCYDQPISNLSNINTSNSFNQSFKILDNVNLNNIYFNSDLNGTNKDKKFEFIERDNFSNYRSNELKQAFSCKKAINKSYYIPLELVNQNKESNQGEMNQAQESIKDHDNDRSYLEIMEARINVLDQRYKILRALATKHWQINIQLLRTNKRILKEISSLKKIRSRNECPFHLANNQKEINSSDEYCSRLESIPNKNPINDLSLCKTTDTEVNMASAYKIRNDSNASTPRETVIFFSPKIRSINESTKKTVPNSSLEESINPQISNLKTNNRRTNILKLLLKKNTKSGGISKRSYRKSKPEV